MKKTILALAFALAIVIGVFIVKYLFNETAYTSVIKLSEPIENQEIQSPLTVKGEARGIWFFEGSFPIKITDANGNPISTNIAQAKGEWMTENFVPFEGQIEFENPGTETGYLILEKDNPSGLPENEDSIKIPVKFSKQTMSIDLYFSTEDSAGPPDFDCSKVLKVTREIPKTQAIAKAAAEELLKGLTPEEKTNGYITSINEGVKIQSISIKDGTLYADFDTALERAVGGSCRTAAIRSQIVNTLKQFPTVKDVIISIDGRTEDILQP